MLSQIRPVSGLLVSTFFLLIGSGLTGILLPLRAGLEGWSPSVIGMMGSFYAACFLTGCVLMPRLVRRVGHVRVYAVVATLASISLMGHSVFVNVPSWFIFRGVAGFAIAGAYMVIESWLNERSTNDTRGSVFSAYMVTNIVGLMVGQFLLTVSDPTLTTLFIFAAMAYAAAVIPTGMTAAISPQPPADVAVDIKKLFEMSPVATVGAMMTGFTFGAWNFQAPVYGAQLGLSDARIATMLIVTMLGGVALQFPLGRASDRMDRRLVMLFSTIIGVIVSVIFVILEPTSAILLFGLMFVFGGVLMPLYSLVVAHANDHADAGAFVETSSGLLIVYGVGSMIGPLVAGFFMDAVGRNGLFWTMIIGYAVLGCFTIYRMTQNQAPSEEERSDFAYSPVGRSQTQEVYQLDPRSDEEAET